MRKLSENTRALLAELDRPQSLIGRIRGTYRPMRDLIELLGKTHDVGAVPALLDRLLDGATRDHTVAALAEIMEQATLMDLARLHEERSYGAIYQDVAADARRWIHLKPADVDDLDGDHPGSIWVLGLASFHANGHVREAAIAQRCLGPHNARAGSPGRRDSWAAADLDAAVGGVASPPVFTGASRSHAAKLPHQRPSQ